MQETIEFQTNKNKRDYAVSYLRLFSMCLIIICHFFQYYESELCWWLNVGVQIFFCISGFLYGGKKISEPIDFIKNNFKKILIPYYCFLLPVIVLYYVFARTSLSVSSVINALLCSGVVDGIGHLWFIGYILFCYAVTPYLYSFCKKIRDFKKGYTLVMFIGVLVICQIICFAYDSHFRFDRVSCYFIGYFLGFMLKEYGYLFYKKISYFLFMSGFVVTVFRVYIKYFAEFNLIGFDLFEQYAHSLLGISLFCFGYLILKNAKGSKVSEISDKYSFYVYLVHQLLILSPFSLMTVTSVKYINWLLVLVGVGILAVLLYFISDKTRCFVEFFEKKAKKLCLQNLLQKNPPSGGFFCKRFLLMRNQSVADFDNITCAHCKYNIAVGNLFFEQMLNVIKTFDITHLDTPF